MLVTTSETATTTPAAPPGLRKRALKDVVVQISFRIGNLALGIVVTALLARTLGDTGFGQWTTLLATFQLIAFFTSLGLDQVAMRESAADPERAHVWLGALVVTRMALTLPSVVAALVALLLLEESSAMLVAGLVLLLQFPFATATSLQLVHQLRMRNTIPMVVLTINSVVWGVCVLIINVTGGGLVALAIALSACTGLTAGMQAFASLRLLGVRLTSSRPAVKELLRIGAPLGVAGLLVNAYARIDQIIIYEQAGTVAAGLYGSMYRMLEQAHFIPTSILTTLAPLMAGLWHTDKGRMLRVVGLAARLLAIGSLGAVAFTLVGSEPVVRLIFGEEFVPGAKALPILAGAFVFICFGYLVGNLLLILGLIRFQIYIGLAGLVVNLVGNLLLVPRYGFMGAAWMTLATEVVVVGFGAFLVVRTLELQDLPILATLRMLAAAGLLAGALALVSGAPLLVLVVLACVLYPALLLGLRAISIAEVKDALASRPEPAA